MINNKSIVFIANGGKQWIGGLYYVKNIIYTLFKNNMMDESTKVYIITKEENKSMFKSFINYNNVEIIVYKNNLFNRILKKLSSKLVKRTIDLELYFSLRNVKFDYLYPVNSYPYLFFKEKCVYWIPDFQHVHLPEMFSESELQWRNKLFKYIAENHKYLILSSEDAFNDYKGLYPENTTGVSVVSFQSDISDEMKGIDDSFIKNTMEKYNLPDSFIFLPNQFWKHKNHITAFKAIDFVVNVNHENITLVCTGNTEDYRNKDNFNNLLPFIKENKLENNIRILGFLSRKEQLALMKYSLVVLQPSLFEGWGTVVEDAKALGKDIIMSDIGVHFEQKNDKCIFFQKENYEELGSILIKYIKDPKKK